TEHSITSTRHSVVVPDTIPVSLPPQSVSVITTDSISRLTNDYAESTVQLRPDGTLHHSLVSRDITVDIPVTIQTEICDTIVSSTSLSQSNTHDTSHRWWQTVAVLALVAVIVVLFRR
ncbi:MAG: hypothetical protein K2M98_04985, partial [Muribaculum sp.]|nr:hypothetical protein [Muribaculum sp.]